MLHTTRHFSVVTVGEHRRFLELGAFVDSLVEMTWCPCNGFRVGPYLFLNDSTSPDGAQEYAIVHEATGRQIESVTFSWMTAERARKSVWLILAGAFDQEHYDTVRNVIETPEQHGECRHCA